MEHNAHNIIQLQKSNCKNCHKCIRSCPVKSIRFTGGQAHIIQDACIWCGQCLTACPQDAKEIADGIKEVRLILCGNHPIIASVAPSFAAYFEGIGFPRMREALRQLGFTDAEETAIGATFVKKEYEKQLADAKQDLIITSCCPSVNLLIQKYYPTLLPCLSPVVSPMIAHGIDIKRREPDAAVIFIGPCPAKKEEAQGTSISAVLTFEELARMFAEKNIRLKQHGDISHRRNPNSRARLFPTAGGILKTMDIPSDTEYTYMAVDGIHNCTSALDDIRKGNITHCFIEMSACTGSCIGGPVMEKYRHSPVRHFQSVVNFAGPRDFKTEPMEEKLLAKTYSPLPYSRKTPSRKEIEDVLLKTGKQKPEDELNCGSCGYDTCREKAAAVCQGKAELNMCLPFLMANAEQLTSNILENVPNGILVLNEDYEVQEINPAAMEMLQVENKQDVLGSHVIYIMDPDAFQDVLEGRREVRNYRDYYPEIDKYLEMSIIHNPTAHTLLAILLDVTEAEHNMLEKEKLSRHTAELTDRVVMKQARIVQEIASLLGETTAETKVALTKLKESIAFERESK